MSNRQVALSHATRRTTLAACLAGALGLALTSAREVDAANSALPGQDAFHSAQAEHGRGKATKSKARVPSAPTSIPRIRSVTTCADDGLTGSLRYEVNFAASGDTIDLSQLMCSTITLDGSRLNPEIEVAQDTLTLQGPGADQLTIDGGTHSNVFQHFGTGTLNINDLTIANGSYTSITSPLGGCIYSAGNVFLSFSVVTHCTVESLSPTIAAYGGGVFALGNLSLLRSTITEGHALASNGAKSSGGGAVTYGDFAAKYSTISNNSAIATGAAVGVVGGVAVRDYNAHALIKGSTISGNYADLVGGIDLFFAEISNSTISGNSGANMVGGIRSSGQLTITNSTIAFNESVYGTGGLYTAGAQLTLLSSIIANNVGAIGGVGQGLPNDLAGPPGTIVTGADNLITSSILSVPLDTLAVCPQLEPLAANGSNFGRTHALRHTSPAIDRGSNTAGLTTDQRLAPRVVNAAADIGAVEWQPSDIDERILASGFDGLCDQ